MPKDFRTYIEALSASCPEEIVRVKKEVDPKFEATTFLRKLELEGRSPLTIFPKVKNLHGQPSEYPLAFNAFSSRKKLAVALDLSPDQHKMEPVLELAARYKQPGTLQVIEKQAAPVKERVVVGEEVDLFALPIPTHHSKDGGPYILGGSVVMQNPETGTYNLAMLRMHVKDEKRATIHAELNHHSGMIIRSNKEANKPTPIAVVIGHHPSFYLGSQWEGPFGRNEYEIASAAMGEPLRVVPSETLGQIFSCLRTQNSSSKDLSARTKWTKRVPSANTPATIRRSEMASFRSASIPWCTLPPSPVGETQSISRTTWHMLTRVSSAPFPRRL
jgi:2,5-furandicarboxylate decarboxylase 1